MKEVLADGNKGKSLFTRFILLQITFLLLGFKLIDKQDHQMDEPYDEVNSVKNTTINIWLNDGVY